jgi:hypothetical protein
VYPFSWHHSASCLLFTCPLITHATRTMVAQTTRAPAISFVIFTIISPTIPTTRRRSAGWLAQDASNATRPAPGLAGSPAPPRPERRAQFPSTVAHSAYILLPCSSRISLPFARFMANGTTLSFDKGQRPSHGPRRDHQYGRGYDHQTQQTE